MRILAGVAMAALSGCVAVEAPPAAPAPAPSPADQRPGQDVAPQIVQGPAREALEAAMPDPTPEPRASVARQRGTDDGRDGRGTDPGGTSGSARHHAKRPHPSTAPGQRHRHPDIDLPGLLDPPRSAAELCELGSRYGGWSPDSEQARICRGTYGR